MFRSLLLLTLATLLDVSSSASGVYVTAVPIARRISNVPINKSVDTKHIDTKPISKPSSVYSIKPSAIPSTKSIPKDESKSSIETKYLRTDSPSNDSSNMYILLGGFIVLSSLLTYITFLQKKCMRANLPTHRKPYIIHNERQPTYSHTRYFRRQIVTSRNNRVESSYMV